ncbi:PucR family transcriptional regulator [Arthrobacter sp. CDRTa11]|uniref:PucR family transcriptional regulator n=1 Tax=Arthrobacter sp. CDRTa11 TaxID=2651199 RepID=UPI002265ACEF|nr:helix-turn-helix domain-containing protein [Arthrobacter sp. CDRTa11]UZX02873.1 PucR family transcriptional regulator [Arthrobacter sp. CDRTa11]
MNLDDATEELATRLGVPVVVLDTEMNLAAHSKQRESVDRAQLSIILTRRGTDGAINAIRRLKVRNATGPVKLPSEKDVPSHVVYPVRLSGELKGYVTYEDASPDGSVPEHDLKILSSVGEILGRLLAERETARRQGAEQLQELMQKLMHTSPDERRRAAHEIHKSGLIQQSSHYTVVRFTRRTPSKMDHTSDTQIDLGEAVRKALRLAKFAGIGTTFGDEGVAVTVGRLTQAELQRLVSAMRPMGVDIAAGGECDRLEDAYRSYKEARLTGGLCDLDPNRYPQGARWDHIGWDRLLVQLPLEELTIHDLPSALRTLWKAADSEILIDTLECYFEQGGNALETAKTLNVHRSTLYYRLNRVRALTGVDLADAGVQRDLHTGIRVSRLAGLRQTSL